MFYNIFILHHHLIVDLPLELWLEVPFVRISGACACSQLEVVASTPPQVPVAKLEHATTKTPAANHGQAAGAMVDTARMKQAVKQTVHKVKCSRCYSPSKGETHACLGFPSSILRLLRTRQSRPDVPIPEAGILWLYLLTLSQLTSVSVFHLSVSLWALLSQATSGSSARVNCSHLYCTWNSGFWYLCQHTIQYTVPSAKRCRFT